MNFSKMRFHDQGHPLVEGSLERWRMVGPDTQKRQLLSNIVMVQECKRPGSTAHAACGNDDDNRRVQAAHAKPTLPFPSSQDVRCPLFGTLADSLVNLVLSYNLNSSHYVCQTLHMNQKTPAVLCFVRVAQSGVAWESKPSALYLAWWLSRLQGSARQLGCKAVEIWHGSR